MNILVLVGGLEPGDIGGLPRSLTEEISSLVSMGHKVTVLARKLTTSSPGHETDGKWELFRYWAFPVGNPLYYMHPLLTLFLLPGAARPLLLKKSFDVVYAHGPFEVLGILRTKYPVKIVYCFHAPMAQEVIVEARKGKYGLFTPIATATAPLLRHAERRAILGAHTVLVRSQFMKKQIIDVHRISETLKPITVIPLSVDVERFRPGSQQEARKRLGLPEKRPLLLTVRRLVARMGLENLVDAMKIVTRQIPDCLLLIGGAGYLKTALQKRISALGLSNSVHLLGFIPEDALPLYYQAADLSVVPTTELEGFGMVTIEALSTGTPVVGTPVGAIPEVLGGLGDGFLTRDTSPEAIAERLIWWLRNGVSQELRLRCREYAVANFSRSRVINALAQVLAPEQPVVLLQRDA